jgi:hypothetical protein
LKYGFLYDINKGKREVFNEKNNIRAIGHTASFLPVAGRR